MEAQWKDGRYRFVARACDIRNVCENPEASAQFTLDNFRPYVKQVEVKRGETTFYKRSWALDADKMLRSYAPSVEGIIIPGNYTVLVTYSEPMSFASLGGGADPFTPYSTVLTAGLTIGTLPRDALQTLEIMGSDMTGATGRLLKTEAARSYIDPALELTRDAGGIMQGVSGTDKFHSLRVEAGSPPEIEYEDRNHVLGHACGGTCGSETEPAYIVHSLVRFRYTDIGSGIQKVVIHKIEGGVPDRVFNYKPHTYSHALELNLPDGLYIYIAGYKEVIIGTSSGSCGEGFCLV